MRGIVAELQPRRVNPRETVAAGWRFNRHAGTDSRRVVHIQQAFEHHRQVANIAATEAHGWQLRVDAAHEGHSHFHARPAVEKCLFKTQYVPVDWLLANGRGAWRKCWRLADLKQVLKMVVAGEDAVARNWRVVFRDFADAAATTGDRQAKSPGGNPGDTARTGLQNAEYRRSAAQIAKHIRNAGQANI